MTATELVENFSQLGPQEPHILLHYLADHLPDARLACGMRICDAIDCQTWLRELGDAVLAREVEQGRLMRARLGMPVEQERWRS